MLYKIRDGIIYRKEMNCLIILSPATGNLLIFNEKVANGLNEVANKFELDNDRIIFYLQKEGII